MENKQKEKASHDATIASPLGGLYEAASVAEHEGKLRSPLILRWRVKAIKADHFVTPTVEFRLVGHEAGPMTRLIKREGLEGLLHRAKLTAHRGGFLQRRKQTGALSIPHFLRYIYFFLYVFLFLRYMFFVHISFPSIRG